MRFTKGLAPVTWQITAFSNPRSIVDISTEQGVHTYVCIADTHCPPFYRTRIPDAEQNIFRCTRFTGRTCATSVVRQRQLGNRIVMLFGGTRCIPRGPLFTALHAVIAVPRGGG